MQTNHHVALHLWQLDAGAVASLETWSVHLHFLAFETWRDASHEHYHIGIGTLLECLLNAGIADVVDVDFDEGKSCGLCVVDLHRIVFSCLHPQVVGVFARAVVVPSVDEGVAIENDASVFLKVHVERNGFGLVGMEGALIARTEMLQVHTLCKGSVATIHQGNRCRHSHFCCWCAFGLLGVPIRCLHALRTISLTNAIETTFENGVSHIATASHELHVLRLLLNALQDRDGGCWRSVVVAPEHGGICCIRSHHHNLLPRLLKGKHTVVLQEHHRFACHVECQLLVFLRSDDRRGDFGPLHLVGWVEIAQFETRLKQTTHTHVDLLFTNQSSTNGIGQRTVVATTLHIGAADDSLG